MPKYDKTIPVHARRLIYTLCRELEKAAYECLELGCTCADMTPKGNHRNSCTGMQIKSGYMRHARRGRRVVRGIDA